ncbi:hypothetical protein RRSWK_02888 [Rhodopirellula sp. SWK7]|nr:hypothetical protein RRSWK_02888 [Rhodopirellula sp. SWK7]
MDELRFQTPCPSLANAESSFSEPRRIGLTYEQVRFGADFSLVCTHVHQ